MIFLSEFEIDPFFTTRSVLKLLLRQVKAFSQHCQGNLFKEN